MIDANRLWQKKRVLSIAMWPWKPKPTQLDRIEAGINQIIQGQVKEMSALSDLQAAEAGVAAAIQAAIALIQQQQAGSVASADVETVVGQLNAAAAALNAAVAPAPTPAP